MTGQPPGRIATRRVYSGRIVHLDVDTVRYPDGATGELEMIRHPGAAAVLPVLAPHDAPDPDVLLIHQYRYAAGGYVWEVPAGRLDAGESPEACARRELAEETGAVAGKFTQLTTIYTTPGFTDERIHLFAAWVDRIGTERHETDEFIEVRRLSLSRVMDMVRDGEIVDGKTLATLFQFTVFRRPTPPK